jgi:cell division protein FtsI (penicillin-binding protein 3)
VQIPGSEVINTASKPGGALKLSIDGDLRWFALQAIAEQGTAIGAQSATAIVLRIRTSTSWRWPTGHRSIGTTWMVPDLANYGSHAFTAQ